MSDTQDLPEEGEVSEKSHMNGGPNRIPMVLSLVWLVFFVWMIAYVAMYMVPSLP